MTSCDAQEIVNALLQGTPESSEPAGEENLQESQSQTQLPTETETEAQTTQVDLAWEKYEALQYENVRVYSEKTGSSYSDQAVLVIENYDQLQQLYQRNLKHHPTLDFGYEPEYFEHKLFVLIQFKYSTGEVFQSLDGIVIKNGLLCPVITIDSQDLLSDDELYRIMIVELDKSDVAMSAGEILIINLHNPERGSSYHKGKFE